MCSLASRYMQKLTQSFAQESEQLEEFSTSPTSPASSAGISSLARKYLTSITSALRRAESSISPWRAYERERMSHERGEDRETTEEPMEHDAPHPSSIEEE